MKKYIMLLVVVGLFSCAYAVNKTEIKGFERKVNQLLPPKKKTETEQMADELFAPEKRPQVDGPALDADDVDEDGAVVLTRRGMKEGKINRKFDKLKPFADAARANVDSFVNSVFRGVRHGAGGHRRNMEKLKEVQEEAQELGADIAREKELRRQEREADYAREMGEIDKKKRKIEARQARREQDAQEEEHAVQKAKRMVVMRTAVNGISRNQSMSTPEKIQQLTALGLNGFDDDDVVLLGVDGIRAYHEAIVLEVKRLLPPAKSEALAEMQAQFKAATDKIMPTTQSDEESTQEPQKQPKAKDKAKLVADIEKRLNGIHPDDPPINEPYLVADPKNGDPQLQQDQDESRRRLHSLQNLQENVGHLSAMLKENGISFDGALGQKILDKQQRLKKNLKKQQQELEELGRKLAQSKKAYAVRQRRRAQQDQRVTDTINRTRRAVDAHITDADDALGADIAGHRARTINKHKPTSINKNKIEDSGVQTPEPWRIAGESPYVWLGALSGLIGMGITPYTLVKLSQLQAARGRLANLRNADKGYRKVRANERALKSRVMTSGLIAAAFVLAGIPLIALNKR